MSKADLNYLFRYCQLNASLAEVQKSLYWLQSALHWVLNFRGSNRGPGTQLTGIAANSETCTHFDLSEELRSQMFPYVFCS